VSREVERVVLAQRLRKARYGEVRPMIHANWRGQKWIAVGPELHHSRDWKTPVDFFFDYMKFVMTPQWGKAELAKPYCDRHPVMQWYDQTCRLQAKQKPGPDGVYGIVPSGAMRAYILLAYDLYVLRHHSVLQQSLVARLRHKDQFQGARHELFAASTCVRAGFRIEYENERDGSKRHTEFAAVHARTGQKINVEAKSKHRQGILGQPGERTPDQQMRVRIRGLVHDAISKPFQHPYIIFLDLNLPPASPVRLTAEWFKEVVDPILDDREKNGRSDPWNLLLFSNFPDHYAVDDAPAPTGYVVGFLGKNPPIPPAHPESITAIFAAALQFGNIPTRFEEIE
jgi:hypothetical protein